MILGSAPLFVVKDLLASVDYYTEKLGFERPKLWGDPPGFAMPHREGFIIMLQAVEDKAPNTNEGLWDAYFWVRDAHALFKEFKENGAIIAYEPELKEGYGNVEFAVKDPDGYLIAFAQEISDDTFYD